MALLLFDIDGTLLLSGGAGARALDRAFGLLFGFENAMKTIRLGGKTDYVLVDEVFELQRGRPATVDERDRVLDSYVGFLADEVSASNQYRLMPAVEETLDRLEAGGHTFGVATGNIERGARIKLLRGNLSQRFPFGGFGCDSRLRAELVARAFERGQDHAGRVFERSETYVIGDTPLDVAAARSVGLVAVAVATGSSSRAELAASQPDYVLDDLTQLFAAIGVD